MSAPRDERCASLRSHLFRFGPITIIRPSFGRVVLALHLGVGRVLEQVEDRVSYPAKRHVVGHLRQSNGRRALGEAAPLHFQDHSLSVPLHEEIGSLGSITTKSRFALDLCSRYYRLKVSR